MSTAIRPVRIDIDGAGSVSGLWQIPQPTRCAFVFAHGAGAGMDHPFMATVADGLARRQIASLRYQFPSMERGSRRPDSPAVAHAAVRAAVAHAATEMPGLPLVAGGKSFGGRMTSQAEATAPLRHVVGLAFLGFPLHAPDQPSASRGDHLAAIGKPLLFLQGSRDTLADLNLLRPLVTRLGATARLAVIDHADHAFHVLVRSGRTDAAVMDELLATLAGWMIVAADAV